MLAGIGYDAHRFKKGRRLILGGIKIKYPLGLFGHSDADVLIHSIMDSLLGAAGMNDIGHLFSNNDPLFKNISSVILLKKVVERLKSNKFKIKNIDSVIIAEKPKIAPYISRMKKVLSKALSLQKKRIGIKATTNEGMDFIGRGEGIASISISLIQKK